MKEKLLKTSDSLTGLVLRLSLGVVFIPHGLQKTFGLFGGMGFSDTLHLFTEKMGLPWIVALLVILIEFLGSLCFLIGFATRFWAVAFTGLMLGIMMTSHLENGFFMNWFGNQKGEGCQFDLLAIGISVALFIEGSGRFSIDKFLLKNILKNK
ncbi:DoxX family protein [Elizabethkingia miricola]|uniref:DoxX family protein n=1 Tax=Elizabethkingia miricola TaxID=172045 RepID=UPI003892782D